ncbi:MAG TPA: c-type cytochrome [Rhizomicrobium sp.]|nr:c-type cytochrome [Rhizomicrobium sp.]
MRVFVFAAALLSCGVLSSFAYAQDDEAAEGKAVFQRCAICHKVEKGAAGGLGPNLFGVVGRKAATQPGFEYSGPLKAANITWTNDKLEQWIAGPAKMVPGTKMAFPGITSKGQVREVVAYLNTLK